MGEKDAELKALAPKIAKLKGKYEEARVGLDKLQEEVLMRGIEMRPGLRRQFEEALRGLFYTMACADGHIDENEVKFYNYLFEEELSVTTFELVRAQLARSSNVFEEDLLATVAAFASYDRAITGKIPLDAPSLSTLLLKAGEAVGRLVIESDGEIVESEAQALRALLQQAKQRAELVKAGAESLLETNKDGDIYDPDAELQRDIRGLERHICAGITEGAIQGADVVIKSGAGMVDENLTAIASATQFVADSIRDDLERGKASMDLLTLGLTQIPPLLEVLEKVENGGDAIQPAWRSLAETTREDIKETLRALHGGAQSRVRMLKEKYDWHDDVLHLEQGLEQAWEILK